MSVWGLTKQGARSIAVRRWSVAFELASRFALSHVHTEGDYGIGHREHRDYDLAPDGRFLMMKPESENGSLRLHVILDFGAELLKRTK